MELSGCIESLFVREHRAFDDRIRACAAVGLDAVEFWLWRDKDLDAIERALGETGLRLTLFSVEPRYPIVDPATHREFVEGLRRSLRVAKRLEASALCVLADDRGMGSGDDRPRTDATRQAQEAAIVAALKLAAPIAADAGVKLLLEPLNSILDHKGHFLDRTPAALDIIDQVAHPCVLLLYDMYHSTMMGERPEAVLAGRGQAIGHVHVADVPGRHEPGSGSIDWQSYMRTLTANGYQGAVGLEYWPTSATADSIVSSRRLLHGARP
ncbi:MAG: TIM barrel protein [Hyphomicrobiales bacterium]